VTKEAVAAGPMLAGKVIAITGGANGIGRGIALSAVRHGARSVWIADLRNETRDGSLSTVDMIRQAGAHAEFRRVDVTRRADLDALMRDTETVGGVDVMVCNAGIFAASDGPDIPLEDFQRMVSINLDGVLLSTQSAAQHMQHHNKSGSIVMISSMGGLRGNTMSMGYCATKGGVSVMTTGMADALGPKGIRVNAVCPGWIETDMHKESEVVRQAARNVMPRIPLRRIGRPEEVGDVVAWLGSDYSSFVTGISLLVDGGQMSICQN